MDARNRNSGTSADETGSFGAAASATQTEQNQSRAQHRQADDAQNEKVRMLIVKRVRMGRPGLVGSSGRQQSEPAGETEERFHALMLCADAEKSSLGFNTLCGENLAVHSAQTPGVCGIFPLREPGGVRPNFYPLEIRARRSLAPLFMVPMRDSGIVEATHASVGMSCIFVSLTPALSPGERENCPLSFGRTGCRLSKGLLTNACESSASAAPGGWAAAAGLSAALALPRC